MTISLTTNHSKNQINPTLLGVELTTDAEGRFNLNAIHKASREGSEKAPAKWLRNKTSLDLVQELTDVQICPSPINSVRGGSNQGTFAHELLAISYAGWISPAFQLKVNQVFIDFKRGHLAPVGTSPVTHQLPATYSDALRELANKVEENEKLSAEVVVMKPKAQALDRIATSDGSMCITDAAKVLQVRPKDLFLWLSGNKWIYRRLGTSWIAYQDKIQSMLLEHKVTVVERTDGSQKTAEQVRVTSRGLSRLSEIFNCREAV